MYFRKRKIMYVTIISSIFLVLAYIIILEIRYSSQFSSENADDGAFGVKTNPLDIGVANSSQSEVPILMWWTNRLFIRPELDLTECNNGHKCLLTKNKEHLSNPRMRGILFYGTDIETKDLPLPRLSRHEWALLHEESPLNNNMLLHGKFMKLFNHTSTFKRESDFPLTTQAIVSLPYLIDRQAVSVAEKNKYRQSGFAAVLYVQSHCDVPSYRDIYVEELMKYIKIDSYGTCLNNKVFKKPHLSNAVDSMAAPDFLDIISKYKFHLAFENALCDDYMTEKLFRVIHVGSIPVYRGSPRATDWMPNNKTIIMVDNFTSPQELAQYLTYLDENDEEYESYLKYREPKGIDNVFLKKQIINRPWGCNDLYMPNFIESFECHVCEKVSERMMYEKAQSQNSSLLPLPPRIANVDHMRCPQPHKPFGKKFNKKSRSVQNGINWEEDYWVGLDKGIALERMMKDGLSGYKNFMKYWDDVVHENDDRSSSKFK